jgi:hypothetical protein
MDMILPAYTQEKSPIRGSGYSMIRTMDLISEFESSGLVPVWSKSKNSRKEENRKYARHMIRFRRKDRVPMLGEVHPEVVLVNAHDGSSSLKLMAGLFRLVCSNGLIIANANFGQETIRHSRKTAAEDSIEAAHRILAAAESAEFVISAMMSTNMSEDDQLCFATAGHAIRFGDNPNEFGKAVNPAQLLNPRRPEDAGDSVWKVFNRVQENVITGGNIIVNLGPDSRRRSKIVTLRPITGIPQSVGINQSLWALATQLVGADWKIPLPVESEVIA